jgi:hypothetical protein
VVHAREQLDLGLELVPALHGPLLRPLDGDGLPRRQHAPVDLAVAPVPELVRLGEVVGAPLQLLVGEPPRPLQPRRAAPLLAPSPRRCRRRRHSSQCAAVSDGHGNVLRVSSEKDRVRTERAAELLLSLLRPPPLHERVDRRRGERHEQDAAANRDPDDHALALRRRPAFCRHSSQSQCLVSCHRSEPRQPCEQDSTIDR